MKIMKIFASGIIAASVGLVAAEAQTLRDISAPAEVPPTSYAGKQYVDSRGCVFIRAGIDGVVNWVPRVSRDRKVLCGYEPTFAKSATPEPDERRTATAETITPPPDPEPAQTAAAQPEPKVKPVARPVTLAPRPAPATAQKPARRTVSAPAPEPVDPVARPAPATQPAPAPASTAKSRHITRSAQATDCPGVTGISRYYTGVDRGRDVIRCGPQASPQIERRDVTVMRAGEPVTVKQRVVTQPRPGVVTVPATATSPARRVDAATLPPGTRIVPRHVYNRQQAARIKGQRIPDGYRQAWEDDRLNSKRAHQTIDGVMKSGLAWTRTVPRKLYERDTGRVVTHLYPGLIYPYHSYAEMQSAGYNISTKGTPKKDHAATPTSRKVVSRTSDQSGARVSSKATPRESAANPGHGRYVQVGTFGNPTNAQRTAARLQAMGLPVRMGKYTRGGRDYRIVMAGPLAEDQVGSALAKARGAGFGDAFVRK